MAKVVAIVTDGQFDQETNKIRVQTAVMIKPGVGETFIGQRIDSNVFIEGTETNLQLNTLINDKIRADVLEAVGVSPTNADIKVTKFT